MTIILFGVTGCGKSTIAQLLAEKLNWSFHDADDYHSLSNKKKLMAGIPLTDDDRAEWLAELQKLIVNSAWNFENNTLACSALKVKYRQYLRVNENVKFVFLNIGIDELKKRFINRIIEREKNGDVPHFMNFSLIESQFAILETSNEIDLELDATLPIEILVNEIIVKFQLCVVGKQNLTL